ncbi:endo-1,3;1,4-beta-D-glucanase-like isoform X2 [Malus sylvestris]|uniref:endo-1,3;1,4-beta-D-glucanase-like isoform X2 n=1 Tax=Malus sylvestris TaxID=3752 RepID=UPI0021ABF691|nr:endo-1,3;1,4-beta-D-glucanase-like isoform X2 [Malus sylvestris]
MSGPQCCSNPPILKPERYGVDNCDEKLGGLNVYVAGSPNSKLAILLISNVFGYRVPNLRKLAENIAAAGFFVLVPDFFYGDPFVYDNNRPLAVWLQDHGTDKGFEDAKSIINALKGKGVSAIGAAGFCWGAKVVTELAKSDFIQAAVLLHPSFVTLDDIQEVKVPIAIQGAEIDDYSPPELVKQFEQILAAKPEVDSFVKIFPKAEHVWTMSYNVEDEEAVKRAEEAHRNTLAWFVKHVK